jgi:hypothetical protein
MRSATIQRAESDGGGRWSEGFGCGVNGLAGGYGVRRNIDRSAGIRDRPISPRSPWQNGHVERLIGSIRRECLDHVVALGERHVRDLLTNYQAYYNGAHAPCARQGRTDASQPVKTLQSAANGYVMDPLAIHMKDCVGDCGVHAYVGEAAASN